MGSSASARSPEGLHGNPGAAQGGVPPAPSAASGGPLEETPAPDQPPPAPPGRPRAGAAKVFLPFLSSGHEGPPSGVLEAAPPPWPDPAGAPPSSPDACPPETPPSWLWPGPAASPDDSNAPPPAGTLDSLSPASPQEDQGPPSPPPIPSLWSSGSDIHSGLLKALCASVAFHLALCGSMVWVASTRVPAAARGNAKPLRVALLAGDGESPGPSVPTPRTPSSAGPRSTKPRSPEAAPTPPIPFGPRRRRK